MTREHVVGSFAERIAEALRAGLAGEWPGDLGDRLRPAVASALDHFELVPRAEFERQLVLLARLEETTARLEQQLAQLERTAAGHRGTGDDR